MSSLNRQKKHQKIDTKMINSDEIKEKNDDPKLTSTLFDWCSNTTIGGFPYIVKNQNYVLKILWLVCFLISTGICLKLLIQTTFEFLSNPVNVNIQRIKDIDAYFPAVSICSKLNDSFKTENI
jgi:hypothetical protein